jgi:hypothetical protein
MMLGMIQEKLADAFGLADGRTTASFIPIERG